MIKIKDKESLKEYAEELNKFGLDNLRYNDSYLIFKNKEDEIKAYNRLVWVQLQKRLPMYLIATQEGNDSFAEEIKHREYIG